MWIALSLSLALNAAVLFALWRQRRLHPAAPAAAADEAIVIAIDNPMELARRDSRLAGPLGVLAPRLIRRRVYQRTVQVLAGELSARGVRARIRLMPPPG
ncbi:MAG: hypothetical protein KGJ55_11720 [Gammaproteobacteria bacterium]|nr:hypothetical protein [Gammaproteobacteria bacterium]